jgi:hypothetical protein
MKISRRDFIHAGCLAAAVTLCPHPIDAMRGGLVAYPNNPLLSQRNVLNLDFLSTFDYAFINHLLQATSFMSPAGTAFATTTNTWPSLLDANGYPNSSASTGNFGGAFNIPDVNNFSGPYVLTWNNDATVSLATAHGFVTFTEQNSNTTYTKNSNGNWTNKTGQTAYIVMDITASSPYDAGPQLIDITITSTGGTDGYATGFKFYRQADESDLLAGKVFRQAFKQPIVNLNPVAIRSMNWLGGNSDPNCRFENRTLPTNAGYWASSSGGFGANWVASPVYGVTSGVNQMTLAAASPTTANPKTTPVAMTHGEIVTCRIGSGMAGGGARTISSIANGPNPLVTCTASVPFSNGDTIVFPTVALTGSWAVLKYFPMVISNVSGSTFNINGIDSSSWGTYAFSGVGCCEFVTLNVAGRGTYPVVYPGGSGFISQFGNTYLNTNDYKTFTFDKTFASQTDGSGNWVPGAWINATVSSSAGGGMNGGVPIEIITALVNEVNEMSVAQGINNPVHLWMCVPAAAMMSMDPDYVSSSNWPVNAVNVVLNGANGYAGLTNAALLFLQQSNELWNGADTQTIYYSWRGFYRWPASGQGDVVDMTALRSVCMARDVKAAFPNNPRLKFILAGQAGEGSGSPANVFSPSSANYRVCYGYTYYNNDTLVTSGNWGTPISNYDAFAVAPYLDPPNSYWGGQFSTPTTGDSALYATGNPTSQATAITNFVAQVTSGAAGSPNSTIDIYCNPSNPAAGVISAIASGLPSGKPCINYEGAMDWPVSGTVGGYTMTAADETFVTAVINSSQWATAQLAFFNACATLPNFAMPSVYIEIGTWLPGPSGVSNQRWSFCAPDTYPLPIGSGAEGAALTAQNALWPALSSRNQALHI